jgi:hypothetical protein
MSGTPNFNLARPEKGTADWNIPLNSNFDRLDATLPIVDTYANRTNYSPTNGQLYMAHDVGMWCRYENGSWIPLNQMGTQSHPVSPLGEAYTLEPSSLQDIQDALDGKVPSAVRENGDIYIKLKRDNYSFDGQTVTVDPYDSNGNDRHIFFDARGSKISVSNINGPLFEFLNNFKGGAPPDNSHQVFRFGEVEGPGTASSTDFIVGTDNTFATVEFDKLSNFQTAFLLKNVSHFCEDWHINGREIIANYGIRMHGANETGGTGTASMQGMRFDSRISLWGSDGIGIDLRKLSLVESSFRTKCFTRDSSHVGIHYDVYGGGLYHINVDGKGGGTAIDVHHGGAPSAFYQEGTTLDAVYRQSGGKPLRHTRVDKGTQHQYLGNRKIVSYENGGAVSDFIWKSGSSAGRPPSPTKGQRYFDDSLGQPIWYDGSNWVDAQGSKV